MMSMKRTILIKEVKYSNQAKISLGITKMTQVVTTKMVTVHMVSNSTTSILVHRMENGGYSSAASASIIVGRNMHTHGGSLGKVSICPELDENVEERGFRGNNGSPTCARVNCRPWIVGEVFMPSHSAKPAPNAKAGSTHRSA